MLRQKNISNYILPGILAISLMAVYLTSMAPGLTWANVGADGGDLIAAAAIRGDCSPNADIQFICSWRDCFNFYRLVHWHFVPI